MRIGPLIVVAGGTAVFFAYLLRRFPYDGLYGVDSYAYYYQARALLDEALGRAPAAGALFDSGGLQHWPVGYHLQIIAGFLFGGEQLFGPRLVTLGMAVLCPVVVYMLVGICVGKVVWIARVVAGIMSALLLPLNATYTRMGLSLMSDVPSLFWALLAVFFCLRLWPPQATHASPGEREKRLMAVGLGATLGLAVLTRYGTALLLVPIAIYWVVRGILLGKQGKIRTGLYPLWSTAAFVAALVPEALYLATHNPGSGTGDFLSSMSLSNIFSSGSTGPDGIATFPQPMIAFYLINPLWDTAGGFLSVFFVPMLLLGLAWLLARRNWSLVALFMSWWLIPAVAYAATPYQAHRFALLYLPVFATLAGLGVAWTLQVMFDLKTNRDVVRIMLSGATTLALAILFVLGSLQCWSSVRNWVATHAAWQLADQQIAALAQSVAYNRPVQSGQPRAITFGATEAIYHYTELRVFDLFNTQQADIQALIAQASDNPVIVVVPLESLTTQWATEQVGERWRWLESTYHPTPVGKSGQFTVFSIVTP